MTTFDKQERAHEAKFAHDNEQEFKINARRTKLFGLWVAEMLNMPPIDAQAYARAMALGEGEQSNRKDAVLAKAKTDLATRQVSVSDKELEHCFDDLFSVAAQQLDDEIRQTA